MNSALLLLGCGIGGLVVHLWHVTSRSTVEIPMIPHVVLQEVPYGGWPGMRGAIWFTDGQFHRQYEGERMPRIFKTAEEATPDLTDAETCEAIRALQAIRVAS